MPKARTQQSGSPWLYDDVVGGSTFHDRMSQRCHAVAALLLDGRRMPQRRHVGAVHLDDVDDAAQGGGGCPDAMPPVVVPWWVVGTHSAPTISSVMPVLSTHLRCISRTASWTRVLRLNASSPGEAIPT